MTKFNTVCPRCRDESMFFSEESEPRANCGECLMNDALIIPLEIHRINTGAVLSNELRRDLSLWDR